MKDLTVEEELQAEMELFHAELGKIGNSFSFRLILILALCFGIVTTTIIMLPDLYFYSILQLLLFSLGLITWDLIDTNRKADKLLENIYARTDAILNKYCSTGE